MIVDPVIKDSVKRSPMNDGNDGSLMKFKHEVQTREAPEMDRWQIDLEPRFS